MKPSVVRLYREFMEALGSLSGPLVAYYSDKKPDPCVGPKGGFFLDVRKPGDILPFIRRAGKIDEEKKRDFRCMFQFLGITRAKGTAAVFDADNFGCPGLRYYLGFIDRLPSFNHFFTSTGFPGVFNGERFFPSPSSSKRRSLEIGRIEPKGAFVVFEPMEHVSADTEPELVVFFENPETISGLAGLVSFAADDADSVYAPFASGCGSVFSWPMKLKREGAKKAVLGVFDPAARPWMKPGEMTLSIPYPLFVRMLASFKKSFMYTDRIRSGIIRDAIPGWPAVRKRARNINRILGRKKTDR